jgi:biotin carboxylase
MKSSNEAEQPLVILGASERAAIVANSFGCPLVHVHKPGGPVRDLAHGDVSYYSIDYTGSDFDGFVDAVLRPLRPRAVVSLTEAGVLPAARANARLVLPGTLPSVVATLNDKARTRTCLEQAGAQDLSVRFAEAGNGPAAARTMAGWGESARAILKPRSGSSSEGIELIQDAGQLTDRGDLTDMILEEFIPGQEYSAETFSRDGTHQLVVVTEKFVDPATFVELGHVTPAPSLSKRELALVEAALSRFLDTVGLTNGPAHTEFKIVNGVVKIIESHSRIGGDGISMLTQFVTGIDLVDWSLRWPLGMDQLPDPAAPEAQAAAIAFATAAPGVVTDVLLPTPTQTPGIQVRDISAFVQKGDRVHELSSSADRVGCAMATGPTPQRALTAARDLASKIKVTTMPPGDQR